MPTFRTGDVVKVPFPYTDRATRQRRPALVVAHLNSHDLLWVLMITSAENRPWPDDFIVGDLVLAGLPIPSLIRTAKIATLDSRDAEPIGRVSEAQLAAILQTVRKFVSA